VGRTSPAAQLIRGCRVGLGDKVAEALSSAIPEAAIPQCQPDGLHPHTCPATTQSGSTTFLGLEPRSPGSRKREAGIALHRRESLLKLLGPELRLQTQQLIDTLNKLPAQLDRGLHLLGFLLLEGPLEWVSAWAVRT
jgi:hypothetical protein